jgi:hypothetical protein
VLLAISLSGFSYATEEAAATLWTRLCWPPVIQISQLYLYFFADAAYWRFILKIYCYFWL